MKHTTIKSSWIGWSSTHRMDASFWLAVTERLKADGHDPDSAGEAAVRAAIQSVEAAPPSPAIGFVSRKTGLPGSDQGLLREQEDN